LAGFRKRATQEARRLQAQIRRETMAELRRKIRDARKQRREALRAVRRLCRAGRLRMRENVKAYKLAERARLRADVQAMRLGARNKCKARLARVKELGGRKLEQARKEKLERERLERELRAIEGRARKRDTSRGVSRRETAGESDDEVRQNLPAELLPVFNRIRRSVRGGPKHSRTEAFLQWAEENPEEVVHIQSFEADATTARLIRELQELERQKASSDDEPAPF
jgi:hypothetical protein